MEHFSGFETWLFHTAVYLETGYRPMPSVVLIYKLTCTTKPKTHILWIFLFISAAELVTKLYEAAVRKVPTSEEYHSHLFMAYARVGEYKKMQQVFFVPSLMSSVFTSCLKMNCCCMILGKFDWSDKNCDLKFSKKKKSSRLAVFFCMAAKFWKWSLFMFII